MAEATVDTDGDTGTAATSFDPRSGVLGQNNQSLTSNTDAWKVRLFQECKARMARVSASSTNTWTSGITGMIAVAVIPGTTPTNGTVAYFASEADRAAGTVTFISTGAPDAFNLVYWTRG